MSAGSAHTNPEFFNRGVSASDLKNMVKSRTRILNEGFSVSVSLRFYHSIPLIAHAWQSIFIITIILKTRSDMIFSSNDYVHSRSSHKQSLHAKEFEKVVIARAC